MAILKHKSDIFNALK